MDVRSYNAISMSRHSGAETKSPETQLKTLYLTENLDPLQGPTHTDPIINTHTNQAKKLGMDLPQAKTHFRPQKQRFGYLGLKKISHTPAKTD